MDSLLKSVPGSTETQLTPVPTTAKKPKLAVNLADVLDEEDVSGTGGEEDGLVSVTNHSGFTFQWGGMLKLERKK